MSYLERILDCNRYDLSRFRPFIVGERRFGWVRDDFAAKLEEFHNVFKVSDKTVAIAADLTTYDARSEAAHDVITELHKRGDIDTWVNEPFPVTGAFDEEPVMEVERSSILYLGLPGFGIHMNGLVQTDDGIHVWIGTRSREKPFFPGSKRLRFNTPTIHALRSAFQGSNWSSLSGVSAVAIRAST